MKKSNKRNYRYGMDRNTQLQLHGMMLPATALILLFSIVPLFGILIAFKDYRLSACGRYFYQPVEQF